MDATIGPVAGPVTTGDPANVPRTIPRPAISLPAKGATASASEVMARWAYCELGSTRFAGMYQGFVDAYVVAAARQEVPFEQLPRDTWPQLLAAVKSRREPLIELMKLHGAPDRFECSYWRPELLLSCLTLPFFGQVQFLRFLAMPNTVAPNGTLYRRDPRRLCSRLPYDPDFQVREPLIAIEVEGRPMLIEGYLRSLLWLRKPDRPLPVWTPAR